LLIHSIIRDCYMESYTPLQGGIPLHVLRELESTYSEQIPSPNDSIEKIMFRAGQRHVVKHLTDTYDPKGHRHGT